MRSPFSKAYTDNQSTKKNVGTVRQTQLITSFGCGSIVDFVYDTVMIAGTDEWNWDNEEYRIYNENLQNLLKVNYFLKPKTDEKNRPIFAEKSKDIPAYRFPEMLYCTDCHRLFNCKELDHKKETPLRCICRSKNPLVAARFVVVCENGHIEDFPYSWWIHGDEGCSSGKSKPRIVMFNAEGKSGINSLWIKCLDCEESQPMKRAFGENALVNYKCRGYSPWLKKPNGNSGNGQICDKVLKTRLRSSSNIYFPVIQSALNIPPWSKFLEMTITRHFDMIQYFDNDQKKKYFEALIKKGELPREVSPDDAMDALNRIIQHRGKNRTNKDILQDEYIALSKYPSSDEDFSSRYVQTPHKYKDIIEKVVLVDKLTEVSALLGFTRVKPWDGASIDDTRIASLSRDKKQWYPGVKLKGEGIFLQFNQDAIKRWENEVRARYLLMKQNLDQSFMVNLRFSPAYVVLHTFSHLLIRQLSFECGYSAASIKEKIYSTYYDDQPNNLEMAGILIYVSSQDADGSLGGLVAQAADAMRLERLINNMLENAVWCSADPLCITSTEQGYESLNYAACHSCVLLPETSCEFRNLLLDRASIVGKPDNTAIGIFNKYIKR